MSRLGAVVGAVVFCALVAGPARGGSQLPTKTLFHTQGAKLIAQYYRLSGRAHLGMSLSSSRGGEQADHLVADRKHPFRLDTFTGDDACRDIAVFGSVARSVKRVVAVRKNGTTRKIGRQRPPASWHYKGRLIGAYIGDGSPTVRVRLFGSHRRLIGTFAVPNDLGPTCSTPGQ